MPSTVRVQGLSDLLNTLQQLPRELASKNGGPVRRNLFAATKLMREEARRRAPEDTGNLKRNVIAIRDRDPRASGVTERYLIGVRAKRWGKKAKEKAVRTAGGKISYRASGDAYYWRFVEFGTEKMRPRPFLRPGFEATKLQSLSTFATGLRTDLDRIVRKLRKVRR